MSSLWGTTIDRRLKMKTIYGILIGIFLGWIVRGLMDLFIKKKQKENL